MPIYPPRNSSTRKKEILEYKVFEFLTSLETNSSLEKIEIKADEVKSAMLNYLKSRLNLNKRYSSDNLDPTVIELEKKLLKEKEMWKGIDFEEIKEYCIQNGYE